MDVFFTKNYIKQLDLPEELNKIIDSYIPYAPPFSEELLNREFKKYLCTINFKPLYLSINYLNITLWVYSDWAMQWLPCIIDEFNAFKFTQSARHKYPPCFINKKICMWVKHALKATTKSKRGYLKRQRRIARLKIQSS